MTTLGGATLPVVVQQVVHNYTVFRGDTVRIQTDSTFSRVWVTSLCSTAGCMLWVIPQSGAYRITGDWLLLGNGTASYDSLRVREVGGVPRLEVTWYGRLGLLPRDSAATTAPGSGGA